MLQGIGARVKCRYQRRITVNIWCHSVEGHLLLSEVLEYAVQLVHTQTVHQESKLLMAFSTSPSPQATWTSIKGLNDSTFGLTYIMMDMESKIILKCYPDLQKLHYPLDYLVFTLCRNLKIH